MSGSALPGAMQTQDAPKPGAVEDPPALQPRIRPDSVLQSTRRCAARVPRELRLRPPSGRNSAELGPDLADCRWSDGATLGIVCGSPRAYARASAWRCAWSYPRVAEKLLATEPGESTVSQSWRNIALGAEFRRKRLIWAQLWSSLGRSIFTNLCQTTSGQVYPMSTRM